MTAVEYLEQKLKGDKIFSLDVIIKQAKEIEKQQIIDAYETNRDIDTIQTAEEYYNETYKPSV